jgi:hypothetical protein
MRAIAAWRRPNRRRAAICGRRHAEFRLAVAHRIPRSSLLVVQQALHVPASMEIRCRLFLGQKRALASPCRALERCAVLPRTFCAFRAASLMLDYHRLEFPSTGSPRLARSRTKALAFTTRRQLQADLQRQRGRQLRRPWPLRCKPGSN